MTQQALNQRIEARGRQFFQLMGEETPSIFDRNHWMGKIMDWCMRNDRFKVQLLRFVDVFPSLHDSASLSRHLQEYFSDPQLELPRALNLGVRAAAGTGKLGSLLMGGALRQQIRTMGRQFILGETTAEALKNMLRLRQEGFACVFDLLGEATVCEEEADATRDTYLELLAALAQQAPRWPALGTGEAGGLDWGHAPPINLSVKPTAFYSQTRAMDFADSVAAIRARIEPIYRQTIEAGGFLCIDMEASGYVDITLELFRQLRQAYPAEDRLGIVLQTYLRRTEGDLDELLQWARQRDLPVSVRLVKGAYWDQEVIRARQHGWPVPVHEVKAASDAAFERAARRILENHDICHLACASHNIRSIAAVLELAEELQVPEARYEFQLLYGMAEPVRKALLQLTRRVRLYCPYGDLLPGMAYLVRRLLENTANDSFLRQSFVEGEDVVRLMADPATQLTLAKAPTVPTEAFVNEPAADFTLEPVRRAFEAAIASVRGRCGQEWPLVIGGERITRARRLDSVNPAAPTEIIGRVCQAGPAEVELAIAAARVAFPGWRDTPPSHRAQILRRAADLAKERIYELAAWQLLEVGKQRDQAHGDLTEGIDFLRYYADQMEGLAQPLRCDHLSGEDNRYLYQPRGLAVVISPWNFPFAIAIGMVAAALVTGNCVLFKPSGQASVTGALLVDLLLEAGVPAGVLNFIPGPGSEIGDLLVDSPDIHLIAFTGSLEIGSRIWQRAATIQPGQRHLKRVICEMGGKNAIIVDDDADLDEAIPHILYSAFGYQGQKCSACSRLIVLDGIYDRLADRLVKAARALLLGPAEDPGSYLGPVVDAAACDKILAAIAIAAEEGTILYQSPVPIGGYYAPLTLVGGIRPEHRTAQQEIFGPVLALMRAKDFDQALEWALSTPFALTGGLFSRSPAHLERARQEFRVGNLYLNRNITGALVHRQPFGGFGLSGGGTKAGGTDYLRQFMDPRVVTENTLRRGFAPEELSGPLERGSGKRE